MEKEITYDDVLMFIVKNKDNEEMMGDLNRTTFPFTAKYKRKYFTPEEINEIKEMGAEQHLKSAYYSQYKLSTSKQMNDRLVELYSGLLDAKPLSSHWDCGHCSYTNFKIIGERYFQSVAYEEWCGEHQQRVQHSQ